MESKQKRRIKVAFVGAGGQNWTPPLIRDIIFKEGMERVDIDFYLLDVDAQRLQAIHELFKTALKKWKIARIRIIPTTDSKKAIRGADFVIIAISTGRLAAMRHDLEIPERYGIYHVVGDTCGPGGWARSLRNIPVFKAYARLIKELAPEAWVLNYTNPMGTLTKVLSEALGGNRVVGLCHGLFACYHVLQAIFGLENEKCIQVHFGGLNHFFWILDFKINGGDGYKLLRKKLQRKNLATLVKETHIDAMGHSSDVWLAGELFNDYGYLPYVGDRHICEFFNCYMTKPELLARLKIHRTSIADREKIYEDAADWITRATTGQEPFSCKPSRETAADIMKAIIFNTPFTDVVNLVNIGQIANLPYGAVVETMGYVDSRGFVPLTVGPMPDTLRALLQPHAEVQARTVKAGLAGDWDVALMTLAADPVCAHLTIRDVKKMGIELLKANRPYLPQFFQPGPEGGGICASKLSWLL